MHSNREGVRGMCEGHSLKVSFLVSMTDGVGKVSEREDYSSYWVSGLGK